MLKINVTGNLRSIAESAWISTISEVAAKSRSDQDVEKVVEFLSENLHTSPFEVVTITIETNDKSKLSQYACCQYSKWTQIDNKYYLTTDLLNFTKSSYYSNFESSLWKAFEMENPKLAEFSRKINFGKKQDIPKDYTEEFKDIVDVNLISYHNHVSEDHSRITWRVKCPLSIAVQILRHRTASFNMVSGRYKTIRQELIGIPNDIFAMLDRVDSKGDNSIGDLLDDMMSKMDRSKENYLKTMKELKRCKDLKFITNDDYKRMREYVRFVLPEGRMTELYITMYLTDFKRFLFLRNSTHAQIEHIAVAQLMKKELEKYIEKNNLQKIIENK